MDNTGKPVQAAPQKPNGNRPVLLRCVAIVAVFVVAAGGLGIRLGQLQITEATEWEARASRQQLANVPIAPLRGNIYDANMKLLAQSATVWTVEASPEALNKSALENSDEKDPARLAAREFAAILELDEEALYEKLKDKESMYYKVKGKVEKPMADAIREVCAKYNLSGIYFSEDTKRYYPYEKLAATALGFVGSDNDGLEGLERQYDEILAGTAGRTTMVRDAWGREISTGMESTTYPAEDGNGIRTTIVTEIQQAVEQQLDLAVTTNNARERGFCIVMDVNTGAILALAVSPSYDSNDPYVITNQQALDLLSLVPEGSEQYMQLQGAARTLQWRNKALADTYEPGSILKIITAAAALDSGTYNMESHFQCSGSVMVPGWDKPMTCAGDPPAVHGDQTFEDALVNSCNVSFISMSANMGRGVWYNYLRAFGLTEPTGVDLPGEPGLNAIANLVYSEEDMGPVELASCSFGQSNKYTAVQMITAVCAAINGGNLMQPYIVDAELDAAGNVINQHQPLIKRQVISPETSSALRGMLESVVLSQNGSHAYLAGYHVGGKSGTSEKLEVMTQTGGQCRASNYLSLIRKAILHAGITNVPVISLATAGDKALNEQPGFELEYKKIIKIVLAGMIFGDIISRMHHATIVREKEAGATEKLTQSYIDTAVELARRNNHKAILDVLKNAVADYNALALDNCHRPQIGVVGEIYLKFNPYANMYVGDWLISQGVEPRFPDLSDFFLQEFVNLKVNDKNNLSSMSWGAQLMVGFFEQKVDKFAQKAEKIASKFKYYRSKHSIHDEAKNAEQVIDLVNQFGEGWLIPAEIISFAKEGVNNVVSLQPFGCIANHIVSKGIEKNIKTLYPNTNLLFLDFDGGTSEVNIFNRLHFLVQNAKNELS